MSQPTNRSKRTNGYSTQSHDGNYIKDHEKAKLPWLPVVVIVTLTIILIIAGIVIFQPALVQSLNHSFNVSYQPQSSTPIGTESIEYLRENGVHLAHGTERFKAVTDKSINMLRDHVTTHKLVEGYNNTLIVSVVNFGFIDFALNFICFIERHNLTNYLLGAVDHETMERMHVLGYGKHVIYLKELYDDDQLHWCGGIYTHSYRQACFNKQTLMKAKLVTSSLFAGYTTMLTDMDIIFMHNPFHYLPMAHEWEMAMEPHEFCTGFYINQPTARNIIMQSQVIAGMLNRPELDDQTIYNEWIHYHRTVANQTMTKHLFPLDMEVFPNGQRFGVHHGVIQHNNWVNGADNKRLKARSLWLWIYNHNATQSAIDGYLGSTLETDPVHQFREGSLLQCNPCRMCITFQPKVPKIRDTFPGEMLNVTFDHYRGKMSAKHP